jgi:histidine triad (HIT) family protein
MSAESCTFCRIASGEAPAIIVRQGERIIAFRDAHPVAPVHILIVPVRHLASINEVIASDVELLGEMLVLARDVAAREGVDQTGYRIVVNTGREAGQTVHHLHMHFLAGRQMSWPPG